MTLMAKQKCPDGKHLMEGLHCIICGEVVIPPGINAKRDTPVEMTHGPECHCELCYFQYNY